MNFGWSLTEFIANRVSAVTWPGRPRLGGLYWPLFAPRLIPAAAFVHRSVGERQARDPHYRPRNLPTGTP